MIPILYEANETVFTTYGIGALSDSISCVVTEERNGQFELVMSYPITGAKYSEIQAERIIKAKARSTGNDQLFRIYRISKPLRGVVSVFAQHISYDLSGIALQPFSGSYTPQTLLNAILTGTGFTGTTDKTGSKTITVTTPKSVRSMLGGSEGSLLQLWGGEYEFDNFTVDLSTTRGSDNDVVIEYGKNLTDLVADHDLSEVYTELLPYAVYSDDDGVEQTIVGTAIPITSVVSRTKTLIRDFSGDFSSQPTLQQLNAAASAWLADNPLGYETPSLTVSFVDDVHPFDYPNVSIGLCDVVTIRYTALGVDVKAKIVESEYDTLLERYTRLTIGKPRANMADSVASLENTAQEIEAFPVKIISAVTAATKLITGNLGGHVVIKTDAAGKPQEILIMDTEDITTAQNVWRWNLSGLGYSSTGYNGTYATAITADGKINADFITTGTLNAGVITAGTIKDAQNKNSWDLNTGRLTITDGVITATHTQTFDHSNYSQTDLDTLDEFMTGIIYDLTQAQMDKYDIDGNGLIDEDDYDRIDWMITNAQDIDRTITTTIDPSQYNKAVQISTSVPATGNVAAKTIESFYSGAQTHSSTVKCDRVVFTGDTHAVSIASEFSEEISIGQPTIRPWVDYDTDLSIASGAWKEANMVCLPPGLWYVTAVARFATSSTGRRQVCVSFSKDSSTAISNAHFGTVRAVSDVRTSVSCSGPIYLTQMTNLFMNCYQNSGSAKNTIVSFTAVRLV